MATFRFGSALLGTAMLLATFHPSYTHAQAAQPSFDQLNAEAKKAEAAKAAEIAKQNKGKAPAAETPAAIDATAPAATSAATPAAATPGDSGMVIDLSADAPAAAADGATPAVAADGTAAAPAVDADGNPIKKPVLRYDKKGKLIKEKVKKEKPPKLIPVNIVKGALTVDGLIAKADLNFQILDLKCFYIWVPGIGTTVISNYAFPGAKLQVDALVGPLLTVKVDGHQLQVAGDRDFLGGKKPKPMSLYVALDKDYEHGTIYPEMGYGDGHKAPYNWPGTLADLNPNSKAPPLPENLKQKTQSVKMCTKNADGTEGPCHNVEIPMVVPKKGKQAI
jgi:hypothetical protein